MKFKSSLFTLALTAASVATVNGAVLLEFDFSGATNTAASNTQSSTLNATGVVSSSMTRGAGIGNNNAGNSFRGTGFSNDGIALTNTDFFQFTVAAATNYTLSIESISANLNGTGTFSASPGVTMAYAYSLDGTSFTLMDEFSRIGSGTATYTLSTTEATALTDVDSVTFRFFASGQTTTGGWGLQSAASPGTIGLSVEGTAIPEPTTALLGGLGMLALLRRRR